MADSNQLTDSPAKIFWFDKGNSIAKVFEEQTVRYCGRRIGETLDRIREEHLNVTQLEMASRIGVTGAAWSKWVNEGITSLRRIILSAVALGREFEELFPTRREIMTTGYIETMACVRAQSLETDEANSPPKSAYIRDRMSPDEFECFFLVMNDFRAWIRLRSRSERLIRAKEIIGEAQRCRDSVIRVSPSNLIELVSRWQAAWKLTIEALTIA